MKIIAGERQSGKTTELIRMSAVTGWPIVAMNYGSKNWIERTADEMRLKIPPVLTANSNVTVMPTKVLVDQMDHMKVNALHEGMEIMAATVDRDNVIELRRG